MDKPGRRSRIPRVRFSVSSGNMVRKAIIKGILSGFRNISAKSMKDMTGIERMMASRGLNNSYTHSKRANNPAIPIAQTNEIDMPKIPRNIVAPTD